jgi:formamidopyrimidine-DNA glycosylase
MPELPELEVVREVLERRIIGAAVIGVEISPSGGPIVVRDLTFNGFAQTLNGTVFTDILRRGKFLVFSLSRPGASVLDAPLRLVVNPKLTGRLHLAQPEDRRHPKTALSLALSTGEELRYVDQKTMGQVYLTTDTTRISDYLEMGPEPLAITLEDFKERLRRHRGELKGILTRGDFVAGIGNAYADEILWAARLHPFRKRTELSPGETERLYNAMRATLMEAIEQVRAEMGDAIQLKPRDFLAVHLKNGAPCPRCGTPISVIGANQRITNFCRQCQPGGTLAGMASRREE